MAKQARRLRGALEGMAYGMGGVVSCDSLVQAYNKLMALKTAPGYLFGYVTADAVLITFFEDPSDGKKVPTGMSAILVDPEPQRRPRIAQGVVGVRRPRLEPAAPLRVRAS